MAILSLISLLPCCRIVAAIQALRTLIDVAKANDNIGNTLACCLGCLLSCIESIVEYFNKWVSSHYIELSLSRCVPNMTFFIFKLNPDLYTFVVSRVKAFIYVGLYGWIL